MSGRDINNIIEIMKHDFHSALLNPIVIIILIAIIILPSLYAIINIEACWDPYEKTGNMKFAVANLDNGTTYNNMSINVGNELVNTLKNNTDFKWVFVSESELREGVKNGTYYSGIIIPQNLSENVVSITSDNPKTAILYYIVNDKTNPVAPRIAQQGANAVYKEMNAKIVEFINLAAYSKLGQLQSSLSSGSAKLSSGAVQLSGGAGQIQSGAGQVSSGASQIQAGASQVSGGAQQVSEGSAKVQQSAAQIQSSIDPSKLPEGKIKQVVVGSLNLANASSQVAGGSGSLAQSSAQLATGSSQLAQGSLSLAAGASLLSSSASSALYAAASALGGASSSLAGITGINESLLGQYFYSPINLEKVSLYEASNYGSQVAPFYLVLSMWVGAVITCVMIRPGISAGTKYSPLEMYFGKLGFYIVMALLQSAVTITLAFIIGIDIDNPIMFIFSCMLVSVVFMILIYSFISALGQIGKGLAILLLVFQISGTGGIYPIEIMDPIFQALYPFLPMTYAINIVRESALGLLWSNYIPSFLVLLGILVATVIICLIIKDKADEAAHYFESKLEESDLF